MPKNLPWPDRRFHGTLRDLKIEQVVEKGKIVYCIKVGGIIVRRNFRTPAEAKRWIKQMFTQTRGFGLTKPPYSKKGYVKRVINRRVDKLFDRKPKPPKKKRQYKK